MTAGLSVALDDLRRQSADLSRRKELVDANIVQVERMIRNLDPEAAPELSAVESRRFAGVKMKDAAFALLTEAKGKAMTTRQLTEGIISGGFQSVAKSFSAVLYRSLLTWDGFVRNEEGEWLLKQGVKRGSVIDAHGKVVNGAKKAKAGK